MGDREIRYEGTLGGPFADRLLQFAREGKLRTVCNAHIAYDYSALVNADDLAACMAATGIGRNTTAEGWCRLKASFAATRRL